MDMSCQRQTKDVVSSKVTQFVVARPWVLAFLFVLLLSVATGSLVIEDAGSVALEPGVMEDGTSDRGP
jgi:hypothetical protein